MKIPVPPADPTGRVIASVGPRQQRLAGARRDAGQTIAALAVIGFVLYVAIALAGGGGRALTLTYPAGCAAVAAICYLRSPSLYYGFTWWTWLLTPMIRRVFDLRYGFHATSPLLLGPLLATSIAIFTMVRYRRSLRSGTYAPFLAAFAALLYAYLIGMIRQSFAAATYDLLVWAAPIVFGLHLALEWRRFPRIRDTLSAVAVWGMLVTGAYGIFQFVDPPMWDRVWVVSAEMYSVGIPAPFLIRVFSTVNAPGPFATLLVCCFLFALVSPQRWRYIALAVGLVALLLTKGRSAWGALVLGGLVLHLRQPIRAIPRQWLALMTILLIAGPVIMQPRVLRLVSARAGTITELGHDASYRARVGSTRDYVSRVLDNPAGSGLGLFGGATKLRTGSASGSALDSGPLEVLGSMGWIGGSLYFMALLSILLSTLRRGGPRRDAITDAAAGVVVAILASSLFGNVFTGFSGFLLWNGVGILIGGRSYSFAVEMTARYANHPGLPDRTTVVARHTAA